MYICVRKVIIIKTPGVGDVYYSRCQSKNNKSNSKSTNVSTLIVGFDESAEFENGFYKINVQKQKKKENVHKA